MLGERIAMTKRIKKEVALRHLLEVEGITYVITTIDFRKDEILITAKDFEKYTKRMKPDNPLHLPRNYYGDMTIGELEENSREDWE